MFAGVLLSGALISGGLLLQRGLLGSELHGSGDRARMFDQVLQHIANEYVDTLADSALYTRAVDGLVSELHDPHSEYLSPQLLARLAEQTSGRYAGVGAQIDVRDGWVTIVAPMPGGPALAAGIQTGDRIVKVDGKPMHDVKTDEAQKALRGPPGSVVRLTIDRPGVTAPLEFALTRREIRVRSVQHAALLRDGVGYVALTIFSEESAPDLRRAIDSLRAAGMTSLIFDLRGDPGGLLDQGVAVAELFLEPKQRIVVMRGRTPDATREYDDQRPQLWPGLPVVALVDSNSASAAEIVAGALQDHDRAVLVGTTTYGKGSAQNLFALPNGGAVKLTTALWYTPSGRSINRKRVGEDEDSVLVDTTRARPAYKTDAGRTVLGGGGITPDVVLPRDRSARRDSVFQSALGTHVPQFRDALTDYALSLKAAHTISSPDFTVSPQMRVELLRRMRARGIVLDDTTYAAAAPLVDRLLAYDVTRYVFGEAAEYTRRLHDDPAIGSTLRLMAGATTEQALFQRAAAVPKATNP